jgi:hypothetical protein
VYGDCDHLKLHDVVEVLGAMAVVPELAALHYQHPQQQQQQHPQQQQQQGGEEAMMVDDEYWQERVAALPPTSQVRKHGEVLVTGQSGLLLKWGRCEGRNTQQQPAWQGMA